MPEDRQGGNPIGENTEWRITLDKSHWERLRANPEFHEIVRLGRIINSLRFAQVALFGQMETPNTPTKVRQRYGSFLYSAALLHEGLKVTRRLGRFFKDSEEFKKGFGVIHANKELMAFNDTVLARARNEMVFHIDDDVVPTSLATLELDEWNLVRGLGNENGGNHCELSDMVLMHYLVGAPSDGATIRAKFEEAMTTTIRLQLLFADAGDGLIGEISMKLGCRGVFDDR